MLLKLRAQLIVAATLVALVVALAATSLVEAQTQPQPQPVTNVQHSSSGTLLPGVTMEPGQKRTFELSAKGYNLITLIAESAGSGGVTASLVPYMPDGTTVVPAASGAFTQTSSHSLGPTQTYGVEKFRVVVENTGGEPVTDVKVGYFLSAR